MLMSAVADVHVCVLAASPYYIYDLQDKHVDEGRRVTWRCEARGVPAPTYTWLKVSTDTCCRHLHLVEKLFRNIPAPTYMAPSDFLAMFLFIVIYVVSKNI